MCPSFSLASKCLFLLCLIALGAPAQQRISGLEHFLKVVNHPDNESDMTRWMHRDSVLLADRIEDYTIFPSPSQDHPFFMEHSARALWFLKGDSLYAKRVIRQGQVDPELCALYDEGLDDGQFNGPILKDGVYQCLQEPLPYSGYWVGKTGFTYRVKNGKVLSKSEWPALQDLYFSYALKELKSRKAFWGRTPAEMTAAADMLSTMLLTVNLREYFRLHPLEIDTACKSTLYLLLVASIDEQGGIHFSLQEEKLSPEEETLFQHVCAWGKTLPPYAFNGYYTHDGHYLPFRLMMVYYRAGYVDLINPIELTQRFKKILVGH